jgi:hypothetical protein
MFREAWERTILCGRTSVRISKVPECYLEVHSFKLRTQSPCSEAHVYVKDKYILVFI